MITTVLYRLADLTREIIAVMLLGVFGVYAYEYCDWRFGWRKRPPGR